MAILACPMIGRRETLWSVGLSKTGCGKTYDLQRALESGSGHHGAPKLQGCRVAGLPSQSHRYDPQRQPPAVEVDGACFYSGATSRLAASLSTGPEQTRGALHDGSVPQDSKGTLNSMRLIKHCRFEIATISPLSLRLQRLLQEVSLFLRMLDGVWRLLARCYRPYKVRLLQVPQSDTNACRCPDGGCTGSRYSQGLELYAGSTKFTAPLQSGDISGDLWWHSLC